VFEPATSGLGSGSRRCGRIIIAGMGRRSLGRAQVGCGRGCGGRPRAGRAGRRRLRIGSGPPICGRSGADPAASAAWRIGEPARTPLDRPAGLRAVKTRLLTRRGARGTIRRMDAETAGWAPGLRGARGLPPHEGWRRPRVRPRGRTRGPTSPSSSTPRRVSPRTNRRASNGAPAMTSSTLLRMSHGSSASTTAEEPVLPLQLPEGDARLPEPATREQRFETQAHERADDSGEGEEDQIAILGEHAALAQDKRLGARALGTNRCSRTLV
jgi:hypothetical protein